MRLGILGAIALLAIATNAGAHGPSTSIGRAVEAFAQVSVSYEPGALVSDVEAGNFPPLVGADVRVAFLPPSATEEIGGGPDAVAAEIAREANLAGTLIVLVGPQVGAWSDHIADDRLAELVRAAAADLPTGSPASAVASLVRSVREEPAPSRMPWGWVGAVLLALAFAGLLGYDRLVRRRTAPVRLPMRRP